MIRESRSKEVEEVDASYAFRPMLIMAIATSIDALAVGISFAALEVEIFPAAALIGAVTCLCCILGGFLGRRWGAVLKQRAELAGGLLLIGIGIKIFLEHML